MFGNSCVILSLFETVVCKINVITSEPLCHFQVRAYVSVCSCVRSAVEVAL
jgi:hypothetical protein